MLCSGGANRAFRPPFCQDLCHLQFFPLQMMSLGMPKPDQSRRAEPMGPKFTLIRAGRLELWRRIMAVRHPWVGLLNSHAGVAKIVTEVVLARWTTDTPTAQHLLVATSGGYARDPNPACKVRLPAAARGLRARARKRATPEDPPRSIKETHRVARTSADRAHGD